MRGRGAAVVGLVSGMVAVMQVAVSAQTGVVEHPRDLAYAPLGFQVPEAEAYRSELAGGQVVFLVEDHSLPLVDLSVRLRMGSFLEPADQVGLSRLVGALLTRGGTASRAPEELDEQLEQLAANASASVGATSARASINCLSSALDPCLELFFEMLRAPRFDAGRLELEKDSVLEELKQRNDDPAGVARREWGWLLFGRDHHSVRPITSATLGALKRSDLVEFHRRTFRPELMTFAAAGDFDTQQLRARIEQELARWPKADEGVGLVWPPPPPTRTPKPGFYVVERPIPQGRVRIGHLGFQVTDWAEPDLYALEVMNDILGGGGFTSRLIKRIRSDEGLAYSAGSRFGLGSYWPESFFMAFQSKSETVALAARIAVEELERLRTELVSEEELETAKSAAIERFPRSFESARSIAAIFASDEFLGRPHDYWLRYRERIEGVTADNVRRVAQRHLNPDGLIFLVVGDWSAIALGDAEGRAKMKDVFSGEVTFLPTRDPLNMKATDERALEAGDPVGKSRTAPGS